LFLSSNRIETLPDDIRSLSETLEFLRLSNNRFLTVPAEELVKMKKLMYLDLQGNNIPADEIVRLKAIFAKNPKLKVFF
jgi:Leucine-rich repeat (LRR) protein